MLGLLSALLFCISANLDNIVIGIAYGTKKIKIEILPNLCIALITAISTLLSMYIGKLLLFIIPVKLTYYFGAILLILLGLYFFIQSFQHLYKSNQKICLTGLKNVKDMLPYALETDKDHSHSIDLKETLGVSLSLAINNMRHRNCNKYNRNAIFTSYLFYFFM